MTITPHRWREEWAPLASIIHPDPLRPFNVGRRSTKESITSATTGAPPAPVKLARVAGVLYVVDGVRRLMAGAVEVQADEAGAVHVRALVADMTAPAMHWEAARASLEHREGPRELVTRRAFWAYIKAGLYWNEAGQFRGYEAIGATLGVGKSSVCRWLAQDFPDVAARARATAGARGGATRAKVAAAQGKKPTPPRPRKVTGKAPPLQQRGTPATVDASTKPKARTTTTAKPHPWRALPACGYTGDRKHSASNKPPVSPRAGL